MRANYTSCKQKNEARQAAFKDSELYGLMKDYTDALARSGDVTHPDVPTDAKDLLITIVRSVDLFDSPQEMHSKFTEQLRVVEDAQFAAEKKKQAELRHAALVGEVAAAQQDVRTLEAEKRVAKAEGKIE